jgi:hypothetical protein
MTMAAIAGLGWGALHAVTGPDHVLSLAPSCAGRARGAWRVGLLWGAGHAAGTLTWAGLILLAGELGAAAALSTYGGTLSRVGAGLALVATGILGWRRTRRLAAEVGPAREGALATLLVGAVHGLTGAAAVLLLLPALAGGSDADAQAGWLGGFAVGSTLAMAVLTAALGLGAVALSRPLLRRAVAAASAGSVALGAAWMLAA